MMSTLNLKERIRREVMDMDDLELLKLIWFLYEDLGILIKLGDAD